MTSRIGNPDTPADQALYERLDRNGVRHFVMVAGAGSGKTTSLVKALSHLSRSCGEQLRRAGQQIACITYTEVAVNEILSDVGNDPLFRVSTIHSFLWSVIKPFQSDLLDWVRQRLDEKIAEAREKIENPRTRDATKERATEDIERYEGQKESLSAVKSFKYGTGSDYRNGVLGHSDILKIGPEFMTERDLMRSVITQRFPVVLIDESQDTDPAFVEAIRLLARSEPRELCVGFFGDPVQKIYMQGAGKIPADEGWEVIPKPENFRCPQRVLRVINNIRAEDDGLKQIRGRMIEREGELVPVEGTARLFIAPADDQRRERLGEVRQWLADHNDDPLWVSDNEDGDIRLLVLVHRMAATRLGFPDLYSALNDRAPEELSSGLVDGTAWVLRPFLMYILPLIAAYNSEEHFEVITLLRKHCPRLQADLLDADNTADELTRLRDGVDALANSLRDTSGATIGDVVSLAHELGIAALDERFAALRVAHAAQAPIGDNSPENAADRFMRSSANELWGYRTYIEEESPFATQQGIKGAEFNRVLVVIDDEEGRHPFFSYGKYFGVTPLSATDAKNLADGKDSVVDRTRRLFYVCCSRAVQDLAVIIFTADPQATHDALLAKGFFEAEDIHLI